MFLNFSVHLFIIHILLKNSLKLVHECGLKLGKNVLLMVYFAKINQDFQKGNLH